MPVSSAPDRVALELSEAEPAAHTGAVLHATSWRYEDAGHLVLTYATFPCSSVGDRTLTGTGVLCSEDPLRPAPDGLHEHHVVAHAARHLAYLAEHDPTVRAAASDAPAAWAVLHRTVAAMPATDHLDAHALARLWHHRDTA